MMKTPQMQTWVPWSEASGTARGTIEEFRDLLKRYKRSSLLIACSRLSVLFNFGLDGEVAAPAEVVARWVPVFFAPQIASRVLLLAQQKRLIFFQAQLRYLAREVMRLKSVSEEHLPPVHDSVLGELLFRAGELLYTPYVNVADPMDELVNKIVTFLPYYEIDGVNAPPGAPGSPVFWANLGCGITWQQPMCRPWKGLEYFYHAYPALKRWAIICRAGGACVSGGRGTDCTAKVVRCRRFSVLSSQLLVVRGRFVGCR